MASARDRHDGPLRKGTGTQRPPGPSPGSQTSFSFRGAKARSVGPTSTCTGSSGPEDAVSASESEESVVAALLLVAGLWAPGPASQQPADCERGRTSAPSLGCCPGALNAPPACAPRCLGSWPSALRPCRSRGCSTGCEASSASSAGGGAAAWRARACTGGGWLRFAALQPLKQDWGLSASLISAASASLGRPLCSAEFESTQSRWRNRSSSVRLIVRCPSPCEVPHPSTPGRVVVVPEIVGLLLVAVVTWLQRTLRVRGTVKVRPAVQGEGVTQSSSSALLSAASHSACVARHSLMTLIGGASCESNGLPSCNMVDWSAYANDPWVVDRQDIGGFCNIAASHSDANVSGKKLSIGDTASEPSRGP
mmetsp:Transcript_52735/g.163115  ORF Transcript_52735/g.163115 Transcript_52735/m.163115 type:complete len:366 (-) Transcript_52735:18-1115(-)